MRAAVLLLPLLAACLAAPQGQVEQPQQPPIAIVKLNSDASPDGTFTYEYETANGIRAESRGQPGQGPAGEEGIRTQGSFSFVADDGVTYSIVYTADENGFVPRGDHIPQPPPIPEAIQKALEYNAQHPEEDNPKN